MLGSKQSSRPSDVWSAPQRGVYEFNVDGAARGKAGSGGICVVVHDDRWKS